MHHLVPHAVLSIALGTALSAGCGSTPVMAGDPFDFGTPGDFATPDLLAPSDHGMPADLLAMNDLAIAGKYPAGPYGNTVGSVIPNLAWEGYSVPLGDVLATTRPYGAYSMDDLRRSGRAYGIVHVSSFF